MNKRQTVNTLQNLIILVLLASAVFLVSQLPAFRTSWETRMQALLTADDSAASQGAPADLDSTIASVHIAVMGNVEYGRHTRYSLGVDTEEFQRMRPLFREALGSAEDRAETDHSALQQALLTPSLCLDLTRELPLETVVCWLGETTALTGNVRGMALTAGGESAMLYLWDSSDTVTRFSTALPSSAVEELALTFAPNGGSFAFESAFRELAPYTVLVSDIAPVPAARSALPDGFSAYNLLLALDFNPHTNSRYRESSGVEVVEVTSGSLRISQDGTVLYSGDKETTSGLYRLSIAGESATAVEALDGARTLAATLFTGTNASPLYLSDMEKTARGWQISFRYQVGGIPVVLPSAGEALTVTIDGGFITGFEYFCRTYTAAEETTSLLPPTMAAAIASQQPGKGLSINYVDNGSDILSARWIAG